MKRCDRGLENAARGRGHMQFFTIRTDPKPVNNVFFPTSKFLVTKKPYKDCFTKCVCFIRFYMRVSNVESIAIFIFLI